MPSVPETPASGALHHIRHPQHDLAELIQSALARSAYLSGRDLRFEVRDDHVVLKGKVRSYYQKQLAQESLRVLEGVCRIQNEIEVVSV